ncbi:MAG: CopD family protein [Ilumatobacteraceae bacterium]
MRSAPRRLLVALVAVLVALATLQVGSGTASAHNTLLSSSPADGAQLAESPAQISFVFDLPAPLDTASAELIDATGVRTDLTGLVHGPAGETEIVAPLPPELNGAVTVRWRLVGPDGHPITGRVAFTVNAPTTTLTPATSIATATEPATTPTTSQTPDPAGQITDDATADATADAQGTPGILRWLLRFGSYAAIAAVIGITLTDRLIWPGAASRPTLRRLLSRSLAAVAALAFVQLLVLAADIEGSSPWQAVDALDTATLTDAGFAFAIRILLAGLAWLLLCSMRIIHDEVRWTALGLAGITLMGTWAWAGHARSQRAAWLGVPVDIAHHTAAALWIAALAIVGTIAITALSADDAKPVMRRMSSVAAAAVAVIVATGVVQTIRLTGNPANLFDAAHGRYLIAKIVLVCVMLGLANHHRTRLATILDDNHEQPQLTEQLRRTIVTEFALGIAVIGVTAAMVVSPPQATTNTNANPASPAVADHSP